MKLHELSCPSCGSLANLTGHGCYEKYHGRDRIAVRRTRCSVCGITHALIPSFSLPDTSHDTVSVEQYLADRAKGMPRSEAGRHILEQGFEAQVLRRLERAYERCSNAWLALFSTMPSHVPEQGRPACQPDLCAMNRFALSHRVNAVFCSRASILLFKTQRARTVIPHNVASFLNSRDHRDSS